MEITSNSLQEVINKKAEAKAKAEIDVLIKAISVSGLTDIREIYIDEGGKKRDLCHAITDSSFKDDNNILTRLYNSKVKKYIISETNDFVAKVEKMHDEMDHLLNVVNNGNY